ncbi:hypothetical protein EXIGLDRAFT_843780 [Exidia glandulosa HHB12029]|uniref:Concanavalin A-like lectin/glucanase n=1 Tax=Exidia glandulosa HHB12029 TaxID=1314781 RepID=A0A165CG79_EXIGL|nr:hypothetical protein EXIGLDRAFT_843780 [Exidia glandulosa HHB12029]
MHAFLLSSLLVLAPVLATAPPGPWDAFNFAPRSKTVLPAAIYSTNGRVSNAAKLVRNAGTATLRGKGSWVALDFGVEVGGLISMRFSDVDPTASVSLSFTESPMFIRPDASDDSTFPTENTTYDGVLRVPAPLTTTSLWTQSATTLRGGFRFLTVVSASDGPVTISNISCAIAFMPHVENLRDYAGYFFAKDPVMHDPDFLTKLWYAGAYTVQTNTVSLHTGRQIPTVSSPGTLNSAE